MRFSGFGLVLVLVLLGGHGARAGDGFSETSIGRAAEAIAQAFDAGAHEKVASLARSEMDSWLVAEELGQAGRPDVAKAFAAARTGADAAALLAYVDRRARQPPEADERPMLAVVLEALQDGRLEEAVAAADGLEGDGDTVLRVEIASGRAHGLLQLKRWVEGMPAFDVAAGMAERIGWLDCAARLFRLGGRCAYRARNWKDAEVRYAKSLALYVELGEPKRIAEMTASVALALESQGRFTEALEQYARAKKMFEDTRHRTGVIAVLYSAGEIYSGLGRPREALEDFRLGLELSKAGGDGARTLRGLLNVGAALIGLGRYAEAIPLMHRARELSVKQGDGPRHSGALNNLGIAHLKLGNYAEALEIYHQALEHAHASKSDLDQALVLQNTGVLYKRLGDDERALVCYERAVEIAKRLKDPLHSIGILLNYGNTLYDLGRVEEGVAYMRQSLEAAERAGDLRRTTNALTSLASIYSETGRHLDALEAVQRAALFAEETGNPVFMARTIASVGIMHERMESYAEALAAFDRSSTLLAQAPAPDIRIRLLWARARIRLRQGRPVEAIALVRDAVRRLASLSEGLADEEGASAREAFAGLFGAGMRAAFGAGDTEALAWFFEHGRAGMLREGLGARDALAAAVVPVALREEIAVARAEEQHAVTSLRDADRDGDRAAIRAARKAVGAAQDAVRDAVARVQREARRAGSIVFPEPDDLATVRGRLAPDEALVFYGFAKQDALALVLRAKGARLVELAAADRIEAAIDGLLIDEAPHVDPAGLDAVRALVASPLELGDDVHRVLVSPMGRLGYVPFALLFPEHVVAYVPSGTAYGLLRGQDAGGGREVLALGDPAYGTVTDTLTEVHRGRARGELQSLPATRDEVKAVGTVRLLGEEATEWGLRRALEGERVWRAVHFACHGLIDPERPAMSALALTPDAENDGFLTCLEVLRLRIPADLVVLSACETGRGRIYRTEGILGLTRAFMYAGAPRVLCSLWKVDDDATRTLMVKFYELWNPKDGSAGLGAAAALRQAQAFVRKEEKWEHPFYWAAWVLWGLPD